jgi:hypothetical protein
MDEPAIQSSTRFAVGAERDHPPVCGALAALVFEHIRCARSYSARTPLTGE